MRNADKQNTERDRVTIGSIRRAKDSTGGSQKKWVSVLTPGGSGFCLQVTDEHFTKAAQNPAQSVPDSDEQEMTAEQVNKKPLPFYRQGQRMTTVVKPVSQSSYETVTTPRFEVIFTLYLP